MRFRRKGQVRLVRKLEHSETWTTDSGAVMTASAGDCVIADKQEEWSISSPEFDRTYQHVYNNTYARIGEVEARPATPNEVIVSREGPQMAVLGDWVVRNDEGFSWLVPGDKFITNYDPIEK